MRDPKRIDTVLSKLGELWRMNPDLRLGQLIRNLTRGSDISEKRSLSDDNDTLHQFNMEDDAMLQAIESDIETCRGRTR